MPEFKTGYYGILIAFLEILFWALTGVLQGDDSELIRLSVSFPMIFNSVLVLFLNNKSLLAKGCSNRSRWKCSRVLYLILYWIIGACYIIGAGIMYSKSVINEVKLVLYIFIGLLCWFGLIIGVKTYKNYTRFLAKSLVAENIVRLTKVTVSDRIFRDEDQTDNPTTPTTDNPTTTSSVSNGFIGMSDQSVPSSSTTPKKETEDVEPSLLWEALIKDETVFKEIKDRVNFFDLHSEFYGSVFTEPLGFPDKIKPKPEYATECMDAFKNKSASIETFLRALKKHNYGKQLSLDIAAVLDKASKSDKYSKFVEAIYSTDFQIAASAKLE